MTTAKPAAAPQPGTDAHPVTRLISATGTVQPATPRDAEQWLAAREFFWLDLECLDDERLEQFGRSLHLGASGIAMPEDTWQAPGLAVLTSGVAQRPSVAAARQDVLLTCRCPDRRLAGGPRWPDRGLARDERRVGRAARAGRRLPFASPLSEDR
jgi:hypothetical protein